MGLSSNLAFLNFERYQSWKKPTKPSVDARQAVFAFQGDVYQGLEAATMKKGDLKFAQKHLRILSGLYGVLKPLDLMAPYRLEMGTKLATKSTMIYTVSGKILSLGYQHPISGAKRFNAN